MSGAYFGRFNPLCGGDVPMALQVVGDSSVDLAEYLAVQCIDTAKHWIVSEPEDQNPNDRLVEWELKLSGDLLGAAASLAAAHIVANALRAAAPCCRCAAKPAEGGDL